MIADMLEGRGTVTGVDISESRLGTCRNMMAKYEVPNVRLILCDGTTFDVMAPPPMSVLGGHPSVEQAVANTACANVERIDQVPSPDAQARPPDRPHKKIKHENAQLIAARWRKKTKRKRVLPNELAEVFYANPHELCLKSASAQLYDKVSRVYGTLCQPFSLPSNDAAGDDRCAMHTGRVRAAHSTVWKAGLEGLHSPDHAGDRGFAGAYSFPCAGGMLLTNNLYTCQSHKETITSQWIPSPCPWRNAGLQHL